MQLTKPVRNFILFALPCLCYFNVNGQTELIQREQQRLPFITDSISYVNCLNRIGLLYHMKNPDSCFNYGFKAKAIATRLGYSRGEANADNNIAIALYLKGIYSESLVLFGKLLPVYRKQADTLGEMDVLMNMSTVYLAIKDTAKAVAFCRRALNAGKHLTRDSSMSVVYANYCIVNSALPEDSILYYKERSMEIATRYKDVRMLIVLQQFEANTLLDKGRRQEALPVIKASLLASRSAGMEYLEINSLDLYATYYASKPDSVLTYYNLINNLVNTKGYTYLKVKVLTVILHYTALTGDKDKQLVVHRQLEAALMAENENTRKFIGDYAKYNAIQNENRQLLIKGKGDKIEIWLLIAVCTIISLLIIIIYSLYRNSRKQRQQQARLIEQVKEQNIALQQADEFKNRLISILAHDFRTPLVSTIGIARMMKEDQDFTKAEMEKFYGDIENEAQTMLQSFDTILQWIKQQLSGYQYKAEALKLHDLVQEAAAVYSSLLETKRITIKNDIPENTIITSDKEMLQFVHRNLLSNAIRFSPEGGIIKVNAVQAGDELVVSVEDNGPGMSAGRISKLFSVTGQFGSSTHQGAGIALSMCRDFIQKLGGRIWAENKKTKGAVFFYAIPNR